MDLVIKKTQLFFLFFFLFIDFSEHFIFLLTLIQFEGKLPDKTLDWNPSDGQSSRGVKVL